MKQRKIKSNISYLRGGGVMIETEFVVSAHSAKHHTLCCHTHGTLGDRFTASSHESNLRNLPPTKQTSLNSEKGKTSLFT